MMLPQRPYFPVGTLRAAVTYRPRPERFRPRQMAEAIRAVGLPELAQRLDEEAHWNRMLSLGEQQRLGLARALLHKPDFLFLDEATASLDEPSEAALYRLLQERLPHDPRFDRPPLDARAFHRRVALERDGDDFAPRGGRRERGSRLTRRGPSPLAEQRGTAHPQSKRGRRLLCRPFFVSVPLLTSGWSSRSGQPRA